MPGEGAYSPSFNEWAQLFNDIQDLHERTELIVATLSELLAGNQELRTRIADLAAGESQQLAIITALSGSVDLLIDMITELKNGLSAEEQAVVDEAMTAVSATLADVSSMDAGSDEQSAALQATADKAAGAAGPTTPGEPPVTP